MVEQRSGAKLEYDFTIRPSIYHLLISIATGTTFQGTYSAQTVTPMDSPPTASRLI